MRPLAALVGVVALTLALAASPPAGAAKKPATTVSIQTLSNRADLISGGDAVVAVDAPDPARITLGGRDVTSAFVRRDGRLTALLDGLHIGPNILEARSRGKRARLTITNHPEGGPIFSGPQIQPWYCLPDALDAQCNRPPSYTWSYKSTDGEFKPYDRENPPDDVATTTTDEGKTVPYIVRLETGTMDRSQYRIAVLADPDKPFTRWSGPPAWNNKVYALHGAGCSMGHSEAAAPNVIDDTGLSKGFAVVSTALADNNTNCNVVVQAESMMMAKERVIERYGNVRYLFGYGCSGGSIAQLHMANAYPGIYDGIVVFCTYPDVPINDLMDCTALLRYWNNPLKWSPGVVWTEPQQAAAAGLASTSVCHTWVEAYHYPEVFQPRTGVGCDIPQDEPETVYHPTDNPTGVRCSFQDYLVNVFGLRPPDRWGPVEKKINRGFANRPWDNVGVQYGLRALTDGDITPAQFVDLNAKIGGIDIDFDSQPQRVDADPGAPATAYRSGVVNEANHLDRVAIIDMPGYFPGDRYEIHDNYKSWGLRERLDAANGHHGNHTLWYGLEGRFQNFFAVMDEWLAGVEDDKRDVPRERKVVDNRPKAADDVCYYPDNGPLCDEIFGPAANPRWAAGMPTLANDVVKCRLRPLVRSDYAPILFTDEEWARLQEAFPSGVCDWRQRGVGQQGAVAWQTYAGGPGGKPLGPAPSSTAAR